MTEEYVLMTRGQIGIRLAGPGEGRWVGGMGR